MEYTFSSIIEDDFSIVHAPINYLGAGGQLKWYVSAINGKANTVLLDPSDYMIIDKQLYYVDKIHVSLDNCQAILAQLVAKAGIRLDSDNTGRYILERREL